MYRYFIPLLTVACVAAADLPADILVAEAPAAAVEVIAARASSEPGAAITVRGVIGGRLKPIADKSALFTIMDRSLVCDTGCGQGWSGCGNPPETLKAGIATVQITDADGKPLAAALEGANGLIPGAQVIIRGTVAPASNANMLIVTAQQIHIAPKAN